MIQNEFLFLEVNEIKWTKYIHIMEQLRLWIMWMTIYLMEFTFFLVKMGQLLIDMDFQSYNMLKENFG